MSKYCPQCGTKVNDTAGVYIVPAFTGLGAPLQRAREHDRRVRVDTVVLEVAEDLYKFFYLHPHRLEPQYNLDSIFQHKAIYDYLFYYNLHNIVLILVYLINKGLLLDNY